MGRETVRDPFVRSAERPVRSIHDPWLQQAATLGKRSFIIQIEKVSDADGETLGYGEIKSVQLDAGGQGQFDVKGATKVSA